MVSVLGSSRSASASIVLFDFNGLASGVGATGGTGTYGSIQNYMRSLLTGGATVTVSAGVVTDKTYTGDGHVVGPGTTLAQPVTLGTSDRDPNLTANQHLTTYDTFIHNDTSTSPASTNWSFVFSGFVIDRISFDYEIFPDGTCTALTTTACGGTGLPNRPDMTVTAGVTQLFHYYGQTPGTGGTSSPYVESPCTDLTTGGGTSCVGTTEAAPQLIGTTGWLNVGSNSFNFMDWPAMIGIDNFQIDYHTNPGPTAAVPEPGTMILLGSGLAAAFARRKKRHA
jgi:hypothetical protein